MTLATFFSKFALGIAIGLVFWPSLWLFAHWRAGKQIQKTPPEDEE